MAFKLVRPVLAVLRRSHGQYMRGLHGARPALMVSSDSAEQQRQSLARVFEAVPDMKVGIKPLWQVMKEKTKHGWSARSSA